MKEKKRCKTCNKEISLQIQNQGFCSPECKNNYRRPPKWYDYIVDLLFGWL